MSDVYQVGALSDVIAKKSKKSKKKKKEEEKEEEEAVTDTTTTTAPSPAKKSKKKKKEKQQQEEEDEDAVSEPCLPLADLFTTDKKQKAAVVQKEETEPKSKSHRKRKAQDAEEEDVENSAEKKTKKKHQDRDAEEEVDGADDKEEGENEPAAAPTYDRPSLRWQVRSEDAKPRQADADADARTVFVGNLPVDVKKKPLKRLFKAHGPVESVRLRGAARPDLKTTKKVSVIKRKFHEQRHHVNAYVRFASRGDAEKSLALNGHKMGDTHVIRVDLSDGGKTHDSKKGVFVGNIDLALEENELQKHFAQCGRIENVRLVRDAATGVGRGFGYVNFADADSVETALQLAGSRLSGRPVRVSRCVRKPKVLATSAEAATTTKGAGAGARGPAKRMTKKKLRDIQDTAYQGVAVGGKKEKKRYKPNRGEKSKKLLSQKLLKT